MEMQYVLSEVEKYVRQAGDILQKYVGTSEIYEVTKPDGSISTIADVESEKLLMSSLSVLMPESSFIAEESGFTGASDYCWVIDPLDGTTNYSHAIPYYCISVALTYKGSPLIGVVYDPSHKNMFTAIKGHGAYKNGQPLKMQASPLAKSVMLVTLRFTPTDVVPFERLSALRRHCQAIRTFGSGALDLAHLAGGMVGGVILRKLSWWDIAAGMLILEEAGGKATTIAGLPLDQNFDSVLACHPDMYEELMAIIAG